MTDATLTNPFATMPMSMSMRMRTMSAMFMRSCGSG